MNCPWFLNPRDASFSDIRAPPASTGSIAVIFAFRFGFDEILRAIGLSAVVDVVVALGFVVRSAVGLPLLDLSDAVVGFTIDGRPCDPAYTGVSARHAAAAKPRIVRVSRIPATSSVRERKARTGPVRSKSAQNQPIQGPSVTDQVVVAPALLTRTGGCG